MSADTWRYVSIEAYESEFVSDRTLIFGGPVSRSLMTRSDYPRDEGTKTLGCLSPLGETPAPGRLARGSGSPREGCPGVLA
jgi:hypothetical protein